MGYDSNIMYTFLQSINSDRELERRLGIVQSQIGVAFKQKNDAALADLQDHERLIIDRRVELLDEE